MNEMGCIALAFENENHSISNARAIQPISFIWGLNFMRCKFLFIIRVHGISFFGI
jgi:hypothetical protein